jgi:hypothetical protein
MKMVPNWNSFPEICLIFILSKKHKIGGSEQPILKGMFYLK